MKKKTNKVGKQSYDQLVQKLAISYIDEVKRGIEQLDKNQIAKAVEMITRAYKNNKSIYVLGNGGSASVASHLACDLGKGTLRRVYDNREKRLRVVSLTDNTALITAYANDLSYENIFLQQLKNLVERNDIVIAISGSGNSKNVLRAVTYAKKIGAKTIGFAGFHTGGKLASLVDVPIIIQSSHYGPVEDIHLLVGHLIATCIATIKQAEYTDGKKRVNTAVPFFVDN